MSEFKPGEIVDITIKGVRIRVQHSTGSVSIEADAPDGDPATWEMPPQAAIARVAPADWPPQHNDLWKDRDGLNWVANSEDDLVELYSAIGVYLPEKVLTLYGPLTLVRREQTDGGEAE